MSAVKDFSKKLFDYKEAHQLTQKEMAERSGLSVRYYQKLEMGLSNPKLSTVVRIAKEFDFDLNDLK